MYYDKDSFVRIMKCRFCGKETNSLALNKRLKPIKEDVYDQKPCEKCEELFSTHKFFIGDCGHSGFIKIDAFKRLTEESEYERFKDAKIFRMAKCFACLSGKEVSSFESL